MLTAPVAQMFSAAWLLHFQDMQHVSSIEQLCHQCACASITMKEVQAVAVIMTQTTASMYGPCGTDLSLLYFFIQHSLCGKSTTLYVQHDV